MNSDSVLAPALSDLDDALVDLERASFQDAESVLGRYLYVLDQEPLASFLNVALPIVDFKRWWQQAARSTSSMVGSGSLHWPPDRPTRIAHQIQLCRALVAREIDFSNFIHDYCYAGYNSLSAHVQLVLQPLSRDIERLTQHRPLPPFLIDAMGRLPTSGDAILDTMLEDAVRKFRDPAPNVRREAVERLWDAWERIKTLDATNDKRLSTRMLLDNAAPEPIFRTLLESEARALTDIGNNFQIRHFETNRARIQTVEHYDYLFHRLYALIHLLLFSRS